MVDWTQAQSSTNYADPEGRFSNGGSDDRFSTNYGLQDVVGQWHAFSPTSSNYGIESNYLLSQDAPTGSVTVVKSVVGQVPGSDWSFDGDLGGFTLPAAGGQTVFDTLAAGNYTVNETAVSGYSQSALCDSGESGAGSVTIDLAAGEDVVCTFTNAADPANLTLVKETDPDGGADFPFTLLSDGASLVVGQGSPSLAPGKFYNPYGVAIDSAGNIYVADTLNNRVQKFNSSGALLVMWGTLGSGNGQFNNPYGVAVDSAGDILVTDSGNNRIQKFDSNGAYLTQWGSSGNGNGQFSSPFGLVVDATGNIYVADRSNHRIQKFDSAGAFLTKWGSTGSGDGQFNQPRGVAVDSLGNVYVADRSNNRVQKFDTNGTFLTKWGSSGSGDGQFSLPFSVTVDNADNVYVSDTYNSRIQKFNSNGGYLSQWGSFGNGNGQFSFNSGITVDNAGNIYIADTGNNRIQKFTDTATTLDDDESRSYTLDAADYTISELVPEDWDLADINCDGGNPQVSGSGVNIALSPNDDVTCTFTNTQPGGITIVKEVIGTLAPWSFDFTGDLDAFSLSDALPSNTFPNLDAGSFTISETAAPGYTTAVACDSGESGSDTVTVELAQGENVTCTFINTLELGSITVVKTVVGQAPSSDWQYDGDLGSFTLPAAGGETLFDELDADTYTVNETGR